MDQIGAVRGLGVARQVALEPKMRGERVDQGSLGWGKRTIVRCG
jgi:hypothetical protein